MLGQFEGDISRMGLKFDEYLKYIKKTPDDLKKSGVKTRGATVKCRLF